MFMNSDETTLSGESLWFERIRRNLNKNYLVIVLLKQRLHVLSPTEAKARVSFSNQYLTLRVVCRCRCSRRKLLTYSSSSLEPPISTKLGING